MERGMKWYKWLINFILWLSGILNILAGISQMTGMAYEAEGLTAAEVYAFFPKLESIDFIYGLGLIVLGVYAIATRYALARYKSFAPIMLYALYAVNLVGAVVYAVMVAPILQVRITKIAEIPSLIGTLVMLIINIVYFQKRADLFVR